MTNGRMYESIETPQNSDWEPIRLERHISGHTCIVEREPLRFAGKWTGTVYLSNGQAFVRKYGTRTEAIAAVEGIATLEGK